MSSLRRRRTRFYVLCCCAFFGAYMAYATIMLVANAEADHSRVESGCQACHDRPMPQQATWQAWGGFAHEPMSSGGNFGGVPSGFRM